MSRSTVSRRAAVTLLGLLAGALIVGATPLSASAHDQVLSTAPASQEHLEVAPTEVSMVFSDAVLDLGATILVVDEAGTDWAQGDVRIAGSAASQGLNGDLPDGRYQVRWRVVSADGHPISGTFDFAIGEVAPAAPDRPASPSVAPTLQAATDSDSGRNSVAEPSFILIGLGGAVAGFLIFVLILTLRKRTTP
jgi:methionine-rich copper-binding protein CopC